MQGDYQNTVFINSEQIGGATKEYLDRARVGSVTSTLYTAPADSSLLKNSGKIILNFGNLKSSLPDQTQQTDLNKTLDFYRQSVNNNFSVSLYSTPDRVKRLHIKSYTAVHDNTTTAFISTGNLSEAALGNTPVDLQQRKEAYKVNNKLFQLNLGFQSSDSNIVNNLSKIQSNLFNKKAVNSQGNLLIGGDATFAAITKILSSKKGEDVVISSPYLDDPKVVASLIKAKRRGVNVNVISSNPATNIKAATGGGVAHDTAISLLSSEGISVYIPNQNDPLLIHTKALSVGDTSFIGSHNFTSAATEERSLDLLAVINNKDFSRQLKTELTQYINNYGLIKYKSNEQKKLSNIELGAILRGTSNLYKVNYDVRSPLNPNAVDDKSSVVEKTLPFYPTKLSSDFFDYFIGYRLPEVTIYSDLYSARTGRDAPAIIKQLDKEINDPGIGNNINRAFGTKLYSEGLGVGGSILGGLGRAADWALGINPGEEKQKKVSIKKLLGYQFQEDNQQQGPIESLLTNTYAIASGAAQSVAFYVGVDLPFKYIKSKLEQDYLNSLIQYHKDSPGVINNFKAGARRQVRKLSFGVELGSIITDLINDPKTTRANYADRFYEKIYDPKNVQKDLLRIARTHEGKLTTIEFGEGYNVYAFATGMRRFDYSRYQTLITPILESINPYKIGSIRHNQFNKHIYELGDILKQEPVISFQPTPDNSDILEPVVKNIGQDRLVSLSKKYDDIASLLPANILYWVPPIRRLLNLPEFSPEKNLSIRDLTSFEDAVKWTDYFYKTGAELFKNPAKNVTALVSAWKNELNIISLEKQAREAIKLGSLPNLQTNFAGTEDELIELLKTENKVYSKQIADVNKILSDARVIKYQQAIKQQNLLIQNSPFKSFDHIFTPSVNPFKDPNSPQGLNLQRVRSKLLGVGLFLVADQLADKLIFQNIGANLLTQIAAHRELNTEDGQVARFQFTGVLPKETVIATQAMAGIAAGVLFTRSVDVGIGGDVLLNSIDQVNNFKEQVLSARVLISSNATTPIKKTAIINLLQDSSEASYKRLINMRQDLGSVVNRRVKLKFNTTAALAGAFISGLAVKGLATLGAGVLNFFNNKERGIELDSSDAVMSSTLENLLTKGQSTARTREDYANIALGNVLAKEHLKQIKTGGRVYSFASQVTTPFFQIPLVLKSDVATGRTSVAVGIQLMPLSGIGVTPALPFSILLKTPQENPYITYQKLLNQYKPSSLSLSDRLKWGVYDTVSNLTGGQILAYEKESAYEKGFEYIGLSSALLAGSKLINSTSFDAVDPNFKYLRKAAAAGVEIPNKALRFIYSTPFMLAASTFKGINTYVKSRVGHELKIPKPVRKLTPYYLSLAMARMMSDPLGGYVGEDYRDPVKQLDATLQTGLLVGYALDKTGVFASSEELANDFYSLMSKKKLGVTDYKKLFSEWLPSFDNKHYQDEVEDLIKEVIKTRPSNAKNNRVPVFKSLLSEMAADTIWKTAIINRDNRLLINGDSRPRLIGLKENQHYGKLPGVSIKSIGARVATAAITIGAIKGAAFTLANFLSPGALINAYNLPFVGGAFRLLAGVEPKTDYLTGLKVDGVKDSIAPGGLPSVISKGIDTLTFGLFGLGKASGLYSDTPDPFLSLIGQYGLTFKAERVGSYLQFQSSLSDLSLSGYSFLRGKTSKDLLATTLQLLKLGRAKDINQAIAYIRGATPRAKAAKYDNITPYELDAVGSSSGVSRAVQVRNYLIQHQAAQRPSELLIDFLKESFALGKITDDSIPTARLPKTNYSPFGFINHATFIIKKQLFGAEKTNKTLDPETSFNNWIESTNVNNRGIVDPFNTWNAFSELSSKYIKNASWLYLPLFLFTTTSMVITGGELIGRLAMADTKNEIAELISQSKINQGKPISYPERYTFTLGELPTGKSAVFQVDTYNKGKGVFRLPIDIDEVSKQEKLLKSDLIFGINKHYRDLHKGLHSYLVNQYVSDMSELLKSINNNPAEFNKLKIQFKQQTNESVLQLIKTGFNSKLTTGSKSTLFSAMIGTSTINYNNVLDSFLDETDQLIKSSLDDVLSSLDDVYSKGLNITDISKTILKLNVDLESSESFKQLITRLQQPINGNYLQRHEPGRYTGTVQKSKATQVVQSATEQLERTWAEGAVSTSLRATKGAFTLLGKWVAQGKTVYELSEAAVVLLNAKGETRYKRNVAAKQFVESSLEYVTAIGISKVLDKLGVTGFKGLAASVVLLMGLDKLKESSVPIKRIEKAITGGLASFLVDPVETVGKVFDVIKLGAPVRAIGNIIAAPLNMVSSVVSAPFRYVFENIFGSLISNQYLSINKDSMPLQYLKGFLLPRSVYADFSGTEGRMTAFGGREPWMTGNVGILLRQKQLERIGSTISADTMISPDMVYGELLGQPTGYAQRSFYSKYMDSFTGTRALTSFGLQNTRISNSLRLAISRRQEMYNQFVVAAPLGRPDEVPDTSAVSGLSGAALGLLTLQLDDLSSSIYAKIINEPGKYANYAWSVINSKSFNNLAKGVINNPSNAQELFKRFTTDAKRKYITKFTTRTVTPIIKNINLPINGFGVIRQVSSLLKRVPIGALAAFGLLNLSISTAISDDAQLKSLDNSNTFKEHQAAYKNTAIGLATMAISGILSTFIKSPLLVLLGSLISGGAIGGYLGDAQARNDYNKKQSSWNYVTQVLTTGTLLNLTNLPTLIKTYKTAGGSGLIKKILTNYGLSAATSLFTGPSTSLAVSSGINELYERVLSKPKLISQSVNNVIKYSREIPSFINYVFGKESLSVRRAGRDSSNALLKFMLDEVGGQPASLSNIGVRFRGDKFSLTGMFSKYEKSLTLSKATQSVLGRARLGKSVSQQLLNKARFNVLHEAAHAVEMSLGLSRLGIDDVTAIATQAGVNPEDAKQLIEVLSKQSTLRAARTGYSKNIINNIYLDEVSANVRALKLFNKRDHRQVQSLLKGLSSDVSFFGADSVDRSFNRLLDNAEEIASQADAGIRFRSKAPFKQLIKSTFGTTFDSIKGLFAPLNITKSPKVNNSKGLIQRLTEGIDPREVREAVSLFGSKSNITSDELARVAENALTKGMGSYLFVNALFDYSEVIGKNAGKEVYRATKAAVTPVYKYGKEINTRLGKLGLNIGNVLDTAFTLLDLDVSNKTIDAFKTVNKDFRKLTRTQATTQLSTGRNLETTNFYQTISGIAASFVSNKMLYGILTSALVTGFSYFKLDGYFKNKAEEDYKQLLQGHAVYTPLQSSGSYLRMHHSLVAETTAGNELLKPARGLIKQGISKTGKFIKWGTGKVLKTMVLRPLKTITSVASAVLSGGLPAIASLALAGAVKGGGLLLGIGKLAYDAIDNKIYQLNKKISPFIGGIKAAVTSVANFKYQQLKNTPDYLRYQYALWANTTERGHKFTANIYKGKVIIRKGLDFASNQTSKFIKGVVMDIGAGLSLLKEDLITVAEQPFKWARYLTEGAIDLVPRVYRALGKDFINGISLLKNDLITAAKYPVKWGAYLTRGAVDLIPRAVTAVGKNIVNAGVITYQGAKSLLTVPVLLRNKYTNWVTNTTSGRRFASTVGAVKDDLITAAKQPFKWGVYLAEGAADLIPRVGKTLINAGSTFADDIKHLINVPEHLRYQYTLWSKTTKSGAKFNKELLTATEFFNKIKTGVAQKLESGLDFVKDSSKALAEKVNNVYGYIASTANKAKSFAEFKYQQVINAPEYLRYQYNLWSTTTKSGVKFNKVAKALPEYGSKIVDYIFDGLPDTLQETVERVKNINLASINYIQTIEKASKGLIKGLGWFGKAQVKASLWTIKQAWNASKWAWGVGKWVWNKASDFLRPYVDKGLRKLTNRFTNKAVYSLLAKGYKETIIDSIAPAIDLWTFGQGSKNILQLNSRSTLAEVEEAYIESGAARKGLSAGMFGKFAAGGIGDIIGSLTGQHLGAEESRQEAQLVYSARDYGLVPYLERQAQPLLRDTALAMEAGKGVNKVGSYLITRYLADATLKNAVGKANRLDKLTLALQKGYQLGQQKLITEATERFTRVIGKAPKPQLVEKLITKSPGLLSKSFGRVLKFAGPVIDLARIGSGIQKSTTAKTEAEKRVAISRTLGGTSSLLGTGIGSFFGPVGSIVGGIVFDEIGSAIGDKLGKEAHKTKTSTNKVLGGSVLGALTGLAVGVGAVLATATFLLSAPITLTVLGIAGIVGGVLALGGMLIGGLASMNKKTPAKVNNLSNKVNKPVNTSERKPLTNQTAGFIAIPGLITDFVSNLFNKQEQTKQYINNSRQHTNEDKELIRQQKILEAYKQNKDSRANVNKNQWWDASINFIKSGLLTINKPVIELLKLGAGLGQKAGERLRAVGQELVNNTNKLFNNQPLSEVNNLGVGNQPASTSPQVSTNGYYWGKAANYKPSDLSGLTNVGKKALAALKNKRVRAFLDAVAIAETGDVASTSGAYGYLFGDSTKETFNPNNLNSHPLRRRKAGGYTSSATGRYQTMDFVWNDDTAYGSRGLGLKDFRPQSQEVLAVGRLMYRGALDDVIAGRYDLAMKKAGREWASLEGNPYGQGTVGGKRNVFLSNVQKFEGRPESTITAPVVTNGGTEVKVTPPTQQTISTPQTVRMLRSGQLDDKGLEKLILNVYGKDGSIIDTFTVNSGRAGTQKMFGAPGTTRSGSKAPVEYGTYNIQNEVAGDSPAVGKVFIPVNPTFKTDRSSIGFHYDADRAVNPGSAGCIVFVSEDELNRFRASLKKSGARKFIFEAPSNNKLNNQQVNNQANNSQANTAGKVINTPTYRIKSLGGREFGEKFVNNADDLVPHWRGTGGYTQYRNEGGKKRSYLSNGLRVVDLKLSINGREDVPVPSPVAGKVVFAGFKKGGLGVISIQDSQGVVHRLLHNKTIDVKLGQIVAAGQRLGIQGSTGETSTTVHVHLETTEAVLRSYIQSLNTGKFNNNNVVTVNNPAGDNNQVNNLNVNNSPGTSNQIINNAGVPNSGVVPSAKMTRPPSNLLISASANAGWYRNAIREGGVSYKLGVGNSGFGMRMHPIHKTMRMHTGLDVTGPTGTPFYNPFAKATFRRAVSGGYGNLATVDELDANGKPTGRSVRVGHLSGFNNQLKPGQVITGGTAIGYLGSTGGSTGPHFHIEELKNGTPIPIAKELLIPSLKGNGNVSPETIQQSEGLLNETLKIGKTIGNIGVAAIQAGVALLTGGLGILQLLYGPFKSVGVIKAEDQSRERGVYSEQPSVINNGQVRDNKVREQVSKDYSGVTQAVAIATVNLNKAKSQINKAVNKVKPIAVVVNTNNPAANSSVSVINSDTTRPPVRKPCPQVTVAAGQGKNYEVQVTGNDYFINNWNQITGMGVSSEYCLQDSGLA